ncbi:Isoleucine--tRNA ligase 2 [Fundidesulfovibrio magnetotacticus]|uniref:Isoleucine--tRNA ligase n=1 Tax=Fundidesulfovibrio magnetotacticus TaxID=2730080 RepID=A0A6V8LM12_9BACT|nr:isoleucine--tRNA ligase [Fundidesulfovibrio magnetotacticus]GFK93723.1 Isoleucine--tRNA ligase 2 [Fundidesulfovibrio magnetotacticus]
MKPAPSSVSFPKLEEEVLSAWNEERTFWKSLEKTKNGKPYVFYDGPPFATGLPHYGHILTSYVKDTVPRYFTMLGRFVDRTWGWDCHGLPIEYEVEKKLAISGKAEIQEYGIDKFNQKCRDIVLGYAGEWEKAVNRIGRWVDFARQYKTMDLTFMESVLWIFSQLHAKGLVYESPRVVAYCNRCMTPLSNFETGLDDSFRERDDMAITVRFREKADPARSFLAWTTTPWTLPSNLALAVGPDIDYALVEIAPDDKVWIAKARMESYQKFLPAEPRIVAEAKGAELAGRAYEPLFPYAVSPKNHVVLEGSFVDTSMGTGIVHMAPAFGEDDYALCTANGIELFDPVDHQGKFTEAAPDWTGMTVFEANKHIARNLRERALLFAQENYRHKYPHCWRCDQPLIYRAISSWYVKVAENRPKLLASNEPVNWVPAHIGTGRFKNWLADARDWSVSRNRFWGTPIPVWKCSRCQAMDVPGSLAELEAKAGREVTDLHRPYCDELHWVCSAPGCTGTMQRVPEVFDCWFESGAMPYGQAHYPFENKEWFDANYPASFIVEYIAQTRGWFYTLMVEGALLKEQSPFLNCICHGVVLAEDGRKMSKRLKNFPDPMEVVNRHGSDALRIYLLGSPVVRGLDIRFSERDVEDAVRRYLIPFWNVFHFFTSYAALAKGYEPRRVETASELADRHILAELERLRQNVSASIEAYDLPRCYQAILEFIETLSGWYVRLNRPRFWTDTVTEDSRQAFDTLYTCLLEASRILAPFIPFAMDAVHRHLTGESVHLADWPTAVPAREDARLTAEIDTVRRVIECGRSIREKARINLRQPLAKLMVTGVEKALVEPYRGLIEEQVNVKAVDYPETPQAFAARVAQLDAKKLGPLLKGAFGPTLAAVKAGNYEVGEDGALTAAGTRVEPGDFSVAWQALDQQQVGVAADKTLVVGLELAISPVLKREGAARTLNRLIQDQRKKLALAYDQRIELRVDAEGVWSEALEAHGAWLAEQCLADAVNDGAQAPQIEVEDDFGKLRVQVRGL